MNRVFRRWLHRLPARTRAPVRPEADSGPEGIDDTPPKGCAWYDSSLDLRRGLQVRECPAIAALLSGPVGDQIVSA